MHYVTSEVWAKLAKKVMADVEKQGDKICDPRMNKVVKAFLEAPGVLPTYSCSGHTPEEKNPERHFEGTSPYLAFVIKDATGDYVLETISKWIMQMNNANMIRTQSHLEFTRASLGLVTNQRSGFYPVCCIRMRVNATTEGVTLAQLCFDLLAEMINEAAAAVQPPFPIWRNA